MRHFYLFLVYLFLALILLPAKTLFAFDDQGRPWHHALALYDQPKYPESFSHFDYVNKDAPKGGIFKLRVPGSFDSLNPYIIKGVPAEGHFLTHESLLKRSADEPFTMYGRIAEKMQIAEDRSWIRFKLRDNAQFSDGSPIKAEDVSFSYELMKTKSSPNLRTFYDHIKDVEILGPKDIVFFLKTSENRQMPLMIGFMPIHSKAFYKEHDFDRPGLEIPLSSGPYVITDIDPGKKIIYKRNPNFWGKDLSINKGHYNFDEVHYIYMRDDSVALQSFQKHEYDFREETNILKWHKEYKFKAVTQKKVSCKTFPVAHTLGMLGLVMNLRKDIFADYRVRQALSLALDYEWLNKNYLHNAYRRTDTFFVDPHLVAHGKPQGEEMSILEGFKDKLPDYIFTKNVEEFTPNSSANARDDLNKAQLLLKEAGWMIENNQLIHPKTKKPLSFEILLHEPHYEKIILSYAHNLQKLGIQVSVRTVDSTQYQKRIQDQDFGMIVHYWNQAYYPGEEQNFYWGSNQAHQKGSRNFAGIAHPVVDYLISTIPKAPNLDSYLASTRALDRLLRANQFVVPLFQPRENHCAFWDQFGYPEAPPPHGFRYTRMWAIHTWWTKPS